MAGLPHNQGKDCPPSATQHGGTFPAQPLVLGPLMGALQASFEAASHVMTMDTMQQGTDWSIWLATVQATMQPAMHSTHHAGHHKTPQIQPQPQMEDVCLAMLDPPHEVTESNKLQAVQAGTLLADSIGDEPASEAKEKDTLQVKHEVNIQIDTAVCSPPGAEEPTIPVQSSHQMLDRCLAEASAVGKSLDKLTAMHTRGVRPREGSLTRVDGTSLNSQDPRVLLDIALARAASVHQRLDKLTTKESSRRKPDTPGGQASSRQTSNLEAPQPDQPAETLEAPQPDKPDQPAGTPERQTAKLAVPPRQVSNLEIEPLPTPTQSSDENPNLLGGSSGDQPAQLTDTLSQAGERAVNGEHYAQQVAHLHPCTLTTQTLSSHEEHQGAW